MLTDFGLARMQEYTKAFMRTTDSNEIRGSIRYMAYEFFEINSLPSQTNDPESIDAKCKLFIFQC